MSLLNLGKNKSVTEKIHLDPFSKECINSISIDIRKSMFDSTITINEARIRMYKGNTSATQEIEADDFTSLVRKIDEFINSLD